MMEHNWDRKFRSRIWRIVAIYLLFGIAWISFSDLVLGWIVRDHDLLTHMSIVKGSLFVLISAGLLHNLVRGYTRRLTETLRRVRESEERFQSIFEGLNDAVFILDENGLICDVNATASALYGYRREELVGEPVERFGVNTPPYSRVEADDFLARTAAGPVLFEWQARKRSGETFWVEVNMRRINLQDKEHILAIARDISVRKALNIRLQLIDFSLDHVADGVYWISRDRRILDINEAVCRMLGYQRGELIGLHMEAIDPDFPVAGWDETWNQLRREKSHTVEVQHRHRSGILVPVEVTASLFEHDGVEYVCAVARDITERRHLEQQNLRSAQLASVGQLAAGVAHEINNPINGVINYAELLLVNARTGKTPEEILRLIIKEGSRIADIVRELLFFAHDNQDRFELTAMDDLVRSALTLSGKYLERQGIRVETDFDPELPPVPVIPQKIEQVLINLLDNARYALDRRYSGSHQDKLLRLSASRVSEPSGGYCRLTVWDHGTGIPDNILSRIEAPFFTTKSAGEGTGLGMSICREIVQQHGGRMRVDSVYGAHTEVVIELPLVRPDERGSGTGEKNNAPTYAALLRTGGTGPTERS